MANRSEIIPIQWPRETLPPSGFLLLLAPRPALHAVLAGVLAPLARRGPVLVVDGGGLFPAYTLARLVRRCTPNLDAALQHIALARAFTCHQMAALLASLPAGRTPVLIPGLLATFYDDNTPLRERRVLLHRVLGHLERLSRNAPLVAMATPPPAGTAEGLLPPVLRAADEVWQVTEPDAPSPSQRRLF